MYVVVNTGNKGRRLSIVGGRAEVGEEKEVEDGDGNKKKNKEGEEEEEEEEEEKKEEEEQEKRANYDGITVQGTGHAHFVANFRD